MQRGLRPPSGGSVLVWVYDPVTLSDRALRTTDLDAAPSPSRASSNGTPLAATTTGIVSAPSAGLHVSIKRFHVSNGGATPTWVALRDGAAGTQHYRTYLPQGGVISLNLRTSGPLNLTTATRLDLVLSAAGSVEYEIDYVTEPD